MERLAMRARDRAIAEELKRRVAQQTALVELRVFGSRARGDADPDSDMDVFVEVEVLDRDVRDRVLDAAWEVGFSHHLVISPLVYSRQEVEESPLRASPILKAIAEEGVPV
ncbi:MAG: nucleotidyltransferase domain-containing protein [Thermodesulfobacteriota bacterium]|jgi:predicted nucleotidyltransferase